ncbi:MAG: hypothetical protein A2169_08475 [Deltaproteobacteria bacterium RBG_13_47_9]|nr:MAG: hypothetical protein A2169_08475 [Deltaproteobacteria bacterium RBG_13_47_9]
MIRRSHFLAISWMVLFVFFGLCRSGWAEERYIVKPGDSLYEISKSFGISVEALKRANSLNRDLINPKQILIVPTQDKRKNEEGAKRHLPPLKKPSIKVDKKPRQATDSYVVKRGDNLYDLSKKIGSSVEEIKKMNGLQSINIRIGQILLLPKNGSGQDEEETEELGEMEDITEASRGESAKEEQVIVDPIGKWSNLEERSVFVRVAKTFLGVPYKLGGSTLKGIDCSAFVKKIYEIFNIQLPRTTREQFRIGKKVERDQLEEGDLVFFRRRGNSAHVGIYIGNSQFVHASSGNKEVKIDHLDIPYFNTRFMKGVRVKELERES